MLLLSISVHPHKTTNNKTIMLETLDTSILLPFCFFYIFDENLLLSKAVFLSKEVSLTLLQHKNVDRNYKLQRLFIY